MLEKDPNHWHKVKENVIGVSEETTTELHRLVQMEKDGHLLFPAYNVNDSVKNLIDNVYGCKESLADGLKRALDIMVAGKTVVICGYGDVGRGCAQSMRGYGAGVIVTELTQSVLQAAMEGFEVTTIESVLKDGHFCDNYWEQRCNYKRSYLWNEDQAIVCNMGTLIMSWVNALNDSSVKRETIKPQVDRYKFPDGHEVFLLAEKTS